MDGNRLFSRWRIPSSLPYIMEWMNAYKSSSLVFEPPYHSTGELESQTAPFVEFH